MRSTWIIQARKVGCARAPTDEQDLTTLRDNFAVLGCRGRAHLPRSGISPGVTPTAAGCDSQWQFAEPKLSWSTKLTARQEIHLLQLHVGCEYTMG